MTLKEFLAVSNGIDCCDNTFDFTIYFEIAENGSNDPYDKFINLVTSQTQAITTGRNTISNTSLLFCDFYTFIYNNIHTFEKFAEQNCSVNPKNYTDKDDKVFAGLRILEDMANGNYTDTQYKEFIAIYNKGGK